MKILAVVLSCGLCGCIQSRWESDGITCTFIMEEKYQLNFPSRDGHCYYKDAPGIYIKTRGSSTRAYSPR